MGVWDFIQDQALGMKWLNELLGVGLSALGLDVNGRIGGSIQFFIYDVLKITVLLCVLIFTISYIQSYFPPERSKRILGRFRGIWANIISALLGTVTPFCSCSSIPLFIGFTSAGLPLGVTFSFLISSPMVDYCMDSGERATPLDTMPILYQILDAISELKSEVRNINSETIGTVIKTMQNTQQQVSPDTALQMQLIGSLMQNPENFMKLIEISEKLPSSKK